VTCLDVGLQLSCCHTSLFVT